MASSTEQQIPPAYFSAMSRRFIEREMLLRKLEELSYEDLTKIHDAVIEWELSQEVRTQPVRET